MTSLATRLAAVDMGGNAVYSDLKPGDLFHFPKRPDRVYEKLARGWYRHSSAHAAAAGWLMPDVRFRTGPGTAVVKR